MRRYTLCRSLVGMYAEDRSVMVLAAGEAVEVLTAAVRVRR
jgi:hypothetical protein